MPGQLKTGLSWYKLVAIVNPSTDGNCSYLQDVGHTFACTHYPVSYVSQSQASVKV